MKQDKGWEGEAVRVDGKGYERGLSIRADTELIFQLDGNFSTFHVEPGLDDAQQGLCGCADGARGWSRLWR